MKREEADFKKSLDLYLSDAGQLSEESLGYIKDCLTHAAHCDTFQRTVSCFQGAYDTNAIGNYLIYKFKTIT